MPKHIDHTNHLDPTMLGRRILALGTAIILFAGMLLIGVSDAFAEGHNSNHPAYWEAQLDPDGSLGIKCDKTEHGGRYDTWEAPHSYPLVVVKGGSENNGGGDRLWWDVNGGDLLTPPINPQTGEPFAISHIIRCRVNPDYTTTTVKEESTTTSGESTSTWKEDTTTSSSTPEESSTTVIQPEGSSTTIAETTTSSSTSVPESTTTVPTVPETTVFIDTTTSSAPPSDASSTTVTTSPTTVEDTTTTSIVQITTTTIPTTTASTLPFTGAESQAMAFVGLMVLLTGATILISVSKEVI